MPVSWALVLSFAIAAVASVSAFNDLPPSGDVGGFGEYNGAESEDDVVYPDPVSAEEFNKDNTGGSGRVRKKGKKATKFDAPKKNLGMRVNGKDASPEELEKAGVKVVDTGGDDETPSTGTLKNIWANESIAVEITAKVGANDIRTCGGAKICLIGVLDSKKPNFHKHQKKVLKDLIAHRKKEAEEPGFELGKEGVVPVCFLDLSREDDASEVPDVFDTSSVPTAILWNLKTSQFGQIHGDYNVEDIDNFIYSAASEFHGDNEDKGDTEEDADDEEENSSSDGSGDESSDINMQDSRAKPSGPDEPGDEGDIAATRRAELEGLKLRALKKIAKEVGVDDASIDEFDDADDPKETAIETIIAVEVGEAMVNAKRAGKDEL